MKFIVTMKNPDALDAALDMFDIDLDDVTDEDRDEAISDAEAKKDEARKFVRRWMEYGEYLRVEFDTDAGTATVLEVR